MDGPVSDPPPKAEYTLTGVLDFLQKSWVQFELERARWNVERAELLGRISQLEGERKGQENLKHDLVRRIKMLEYALKQERMRYSQQGEGNKTNEPPVPTQSPQVNVPPTRLVRTAARRDTLRKYLQELGSGDIMLVKTPPAFVMPAVLTAGLAKISSQLNAHIPNISPADSLSSDSHPASSLPDPSSPTAIDVPSSNHIAQQLEASLVTPPSTSPPLTLDSFSENLNSSNPSLSDFAKGPIPDAQELLASLSSPSMDAPQPISVDASANNNISSNDNHNSNNISNSINSNNINDSTNNNLNNININKPPEIPPADETQGEYGNISAASMKRMMGRLKMKGGGNQLAELRNLMDGSKKKDSLNKADFSAAADTTPSPATPPVTHTPTQTSEEKSKPSKPPPKPEAGLAPELADLTLEDDTPNTTVSGARSWKNKYTLRSHFDGVWSLVFHPTEAVLLSGSEDGTWKMWNLQSLAPTVHKTPSTELEPIYTFRGHTGPVFSLALAAERGKALSAGGDSTVRVWTLPPATLDPYERHGVGVDYHVRTLEGHTDAIWSLALHPYHPRVLSASADDSVRFWDYEHPNPLLHTLTLTDSSGHTHTPTSVDVVHTDLTHCIAAYTSASISTFDLETGRPVLSIFHNEDRSAQINKIITHPTLSLAITAHEDKKISFLDLKSGQNIYTMVGHLDAVSALAIDPSALYLLSAGHDSSLRFWDITSRTCVQEVTAHRPKYNESIHSVAYHPSKTFVASGGADSTVRIYM